MVDVYRNFKFEVEIEGFVRAGFAKVDGLNDSTEVVEYREGGDNESPRKLPGQTSFEDITFERGMSEDSDFSNWRKLLFNSDQQAGAQGGDDYRKTLTIYLKNKAGTRVKKWVVKRAWPNAKNSPSFDASANEVAIESLVVSHEGYTETTL